LENLPASVVVIAHSSPSSSPPIREASKLRWTHKHLDWMDGWWDGWRDESMERTTTTGQTKDII
jgi:hypothetical protein